MKHRRRAHLTTARSALALSALALSGVLALSGCSAPAEDAKTAEPTSPLIDYLGALSGGDLSPEEQEEKYREQDRKREELVATCMQESGFDYTPSVQSASFSSSDADAYKPDDREWVAQYGYGVVDSPGRYDSAEPEDEYVDANSEYYDSLSESEKAAYSEALHGPAEPEDAAASEDGSYEYDWTTAGCFGAAQHELEGEDPASAETHKPVMDALNDFYADLQSVPELADLDAAWSSCLSDAGYPGFATPYDAVNSISDKLTAVYDAAGDQVVEPTDPKLVALKDEEIELALADLDCREKTDYTAVHKKVQDALEQQFIDDHRAELDALKADAEQGE
ncbi:hypothetical protein EDF35_2742 [Rathayibacter sp. PhB151]|uniref:hypothetical protein n=1 Tax=Rathayibacter sp. PhB151 TaxID=2485189 RepID=UPI001062A3AE|nr:hypothetical protein [Rathayibacter sp. PhB151]TDX79501.1 hypothetical protein EDF35_2742 [Rathayibacter sp. PhB151]